ncbi:MAG: hypothetical protein AAGF01_03550 [Cyanobacteria bacterium P01_G01_bin.38]
MNIARLKYTIKRAFTTAIVLLLALLTVCKTLMVLLLIRGRTRVMVKDWYGRLGNNLIQLANAQYFSQQLGLAPCEVPPHDFLQVDKLFDIHTTVPRQFMKTEPKLIARGALLRLGGWAYELVNNWGSPEEYQSTQSIFRNFYFSLETFPIRPKIGDYRILFRNEIGALIPYRKDDCISAGTLVIHMRGGDVFCEHPHPAYTQPPLSFYQAVIQQHSTGEIVIVSQAQRKNPCLAALLDEYPNIRVQSGSLMEDVNTLLTAQHLVAGTGTFAISLAFCSQAIKTLYLPILDINRRSGTVKLLPSIWSPMNILGAKADLDFEVCGFKIKDYTAIGSWANSNEQRNLMMAHAVEKVMLLSM